MKKIIILGSSGSIGTQTLDVIRHSGLFDVVGLSVHHNTKLLEQHAREFHPKAVAVADEAAAAHLKIALADTDITVLAGEEGVCQLAALEADLVVSAMVGIAGLLPTMAAIEQGTDIALANKETLVTAGGVVTAAARAKGAALLPIDSEHSAIFQCMGNHPAQQINRLILTASGGAFFGKTRAELAGVTAADALRHPNWSMGQKVTIDSATLMNKGLEIMEAHWLFGIDYDHIDVVVQRESIIHSMVEFCDGSVLAQLGPPDMRNPIHYALHHPQRVTSQLPRLDFAALQQLRFALPDTETFRCLPLAIQAGKTGGTMPAVLNAANEVAVAQFLQGKLPFLGIADVVERAMERHKPCINPTLLDIIESDRQIRSEVTQG